MKRKPLETTLLGIALSGYLCLNSTTGIATEASNIAVIADGTELTAFWESVPEAEHYNVYYAPYPDADPVNKYVYGPETTSFNLQLPDGAAYYLAVKPESNGQESEWSNVEHFVLSNAPDTQVLPSELTGVWALKGYGRLYDFSDDMVVVYQVNDKNCQVYDSFPVEYMDLDLGLLPMTADGRYIEIQPSASNDYIHSYQYEYLGDLPALCADGLTQPTTDPLVNYEVLWNSFNENYAFFDLREVDWTAVDETVRPLLSDIDSEEELLQLFKDVIATINDGHNHLSNPQEGTDWSAGAPPSWLVRVGNYFQSTNSEEDLLEAFEEQNEFTDLNEFKDAQFLHFLIQAIELSNDNIGSYVNIVDCQADGHICLGLTENNAAYLKIDQMAGYNSGDGDESDIAIVQAIMDAVIPEIQGTQALIIDLRHNQGGSDNISMEIAGRFTQSPQLAFRKKARQKDTFGNAQEVILSPTGDQQYLQPVYLLISNETASAAEAFTLMMKGLDQVTIIGEPSAGILSDQLDKKLPNGWHFTLSNEIYSDPDGNVYEGTGIPVDHYVEFLAPTDVLEGRDIGIEKALELMD